MSFLLVLRLTLFLDNPQAGCLLENDVDLTLLFGAIFVLLFIFVALELLRVVLAEVLILDQTGKFDALSEILDLNCVLLSKVVSRGLLKLLLFKNIHLLNKSSH